MLSSPAPRVAELQEYVRSMDAAAIDAVMASLAAHAAAGAAADAPAPPSGVPSDATSSVSPFSSKYVPPLSLVAYGRRLLKYSYCAPHGILIGVVLLCRYCKTTRHRLTPHTVHRLLLTSTVVALKTHFDVFYSNQYYAQVGGITTPELNRLEVAFLDGIHFGATATLEELCAITQRLSREARRVPLDKHLAPVALDRLSPEHVADVEAAQREIARALHDSAVAPLPFRSDEPRIRFSQPGNDTARVVTIAEPAAPAAPHRAQKAVPKASSTNGLDSDFIDGTGMRSHASSRRASGSAFTDV